MLGMFRHRHDWGLWRWQVDYRTDQPRGFITGKWIRYCKHCAGFQYDKDRTRNSVEKWRLKYLKRN